MIYDRVLTEPLARLSVCISHPSLSSIHPFHPASLPSLHLGRSELFPQSLHYNNNGRFMLLCGDGEYSISTTRVLRSKCFGPALEAVWAADGNGDYAVKEVRSPREPPSRRRRA